MKCGLRVLIMNKKLLILLLIVILFIVGCNQEQYDISKSDGDDTIKQPKEQEIEHLEEKEGVIETITLNMCKIDKENEDIWIQGYVNLFKEPAGLKLAGKLPPCSSINLEVIEKRNVDGIDFYKVRYGKVIGWQTKRLLVGE